MKKRGYFLLCLFILLLTQFSFALYETEIFSETVEHGKIIKAADIEFILKYDPNSRKAFVQMDGSGFFVDENSCNIKDNINVCIKNISFWYRNATTLFDTYRSEITISKITSNLEITHTIRDDTLTLDETTDVTITFENNGDISAENLKTTIPIPEELLVAKTENCQITNEGVVFESIINPTNVKTCKYTVKAVKSGEFDLVANTSYFDGVEEVTTSTKRTGLVNNQSLQITLLSNNFVELGQILNVSIETKNIVEENEITISSLKITVPSDFKIIETPVGMSSSGNIFLWEGTLEGLQNQTFTFALKPQVTGTKEITIDSAYKENGFTRRPQNKIPITVNCTCPYIDHSLFPSEEKIDLFLINPNKNQPFKNIRISYNDGESEQSKEFDEITPNGHIEIDTRSTKQINQIAIDAWFESTYKEKFKESKIIHLKDNIESNNSTNTTEKEEQDKKEENDDNANTEATDEQKETESAANQTDEAAAKNDIKETIQEQSGKILEVATTEVDRDTTTDIVIGAGIILSAFLTLSIIIMLRKKNKMKVKGKTLDDIAEELDKMEAKKGE